MNSMGHQKLLTLAVALLHVGGAAAFNAGIVSPMTISARASPVLQLRQQPGQSAADRAAARAARRAATINPQPGSNAPPPTSTVPPNYMQPPTSVRPHVNMAPPNYMQPPSRVRPQVNMPPPAHVPPPTNMPPPTPMPLTNAVGSVAPVRAMSARDRIIASQRSRLRAGVGASNGAAYAPQPSHGAPVADAPQMGMVYQVLEEFVQSDFARSLCQYCNVSPTAYGQVRGMFEEVRLHDATLVVNLNRNFEQRSEKLLNKLQQHLRERMGGQVQRLQYETKSPPTTKILIV